MIPCPAQPFDTPPARARGEFLLVLVMVMWVLAASGATVGAAEPKASLDRSTVIAGETANLAIEFEGDAPAGAPRVTAPTGLTIGYVGQNSQVSIINGQYRSSVAHNYQIRTRQPGDFVIPAATATVGGKQVAANPVTLKVLPPGTASEADPASLRPVFLRLVVHKTNVFVGEVLPLDIRVYFQNARFKQPPQFEAEGFTTGRLQQQGTATTVFANQNFRLLTFQTYVVPAKSGRLQLGPATMPATLPHPQSRINLFGEPVDWINQDAIGPAVPLEVSPLPSQNVPPDFDGAVGRFDMTVTLSTNRVTVGDPITLTIRITGRGLLENLAPGSIRDWPGFRIYPPESRVEPADQAGIQGTKVLEQVVIPERPDLAEIPPITFSYFDPDTAAYRTLTHAATRIEVRPGAATAAAAPMVPGNAPPPEVPDLVHIKQHPGPLADFAKPLVFRPRFVGLAVFPVAVAWVAWQWRRRRDALAADPRRLRAAQVRKTVKAGLERLRLLNAPGEAPEFFSTAFRLLQEQLGERLGLPAGAITESALDERLPALGASAGLIASLHELFHDCNQARYAAGSGPVNPTEVLARLESALSQLQELPGHDS